MSKSAWELSTVSILSALNKEPCVDGYLISDLKYTVLDAQHVSFHDAQVLAELNQIDPHLPPKEYVTFRPERLAWHETIVAVSTQLKIENEQDLHVKCMQIYETAIDEIEELKLESMREEKKIHVAKLLRDHENGIDIKDRYGGEELLTVYEKIKCKMIVFGNYKENYTEADAICDRVADILYTEEANKQLTHIIDKKISEQQNLSFLDIPEPHQRLTLMINGGQASGKGSSVARLKVNAESLGIAWNNFVKINTDSYKALLLEPGTTKPELYSQLAQEEAALIHQKVQTRLLQKAKEGNAPHIFIDQVFVGEDKIKLGLINGGKVRGIVVSTDTSNAIERSYSRGKSEGTRGRYENTRGILRCHKFVTRELPITLSKFSEEDVSFLLVDNNVPQNVQPTDVMTIDLKAKEITIYSRENLERFIKKERINVDARSKDDLYLEDKGDRIYLNYLEPLRVENKCKILDTSVPDDDNSLIEIKSAKI